MPENLYEAETGTTDLIFASDMAEDEVTPLELRLTAGKLYEADEVRDEIGNPDVPRYGDWVPVETAADRPEDPSFAMAPAELIEELQDKAIQPGDTFTVTRCEKIETQHYERYEVNVETEA